ncbi:MAG: tRNA epoxyqueuosine(34) reductase QueG [Phycisphaerales bacterium]|nr:tRNA epoxyqueuosine(34) reductase QueG [Phycisphaerales bacterium]
MNVDGIAADADPESLTRRVLARCRDLGFALAGVCDALPTSHEDHVRAWITAGRHGTMEYLQRRIEERLAPETYVPGAASIIMVADRYHDGHRDRIDSDSAPRGRIARYARGRDYHKVMKRRLVQLARELGEILPDHHFRPCVDTAPLLEREHAMRAGLGLVGKNTLLIEPGVGSWMLLGGIVSTARLIPTSPKTERSDPCGTCSRCIDACPTDAITPFSVDATRCLAYTTIEHRGEITPELETAAGDWLFGCDICQEVCPHAARKKRRQALPIHPDYAERHSDFDLLEVLGWTDASRQVVIEGTAAKRAALGMWKRNALICAGNVLTEHPDAPGKMELLGRMREIAGDFDEDAAVRGTAARVLDRLSMSDGI